MLAERLLEIGSGGFHGICPGDEVEQFIEPRGVRGCGRPHVSGGIGGGYLRTGNDGSLRVRYLAHDASRSLLCE